LDKEEIPDKIETFSYALEKIFGIGARYLEVLVMRTLHDKIGEINKSSPKSESTLELTFQNYIENMKENYRKITSSTEPITFAASGTEDLLNPTVQAKAKNTKLFRREQNWLD
jgi:hypothetical protein